MQRVQQMETSPGTSSSLRQYSTVLANVPLRSSQTNLEYHKSSERPHARLRFPALSPAQGPLALVPHLELVLVFVP